MAPENDMNEGIDLVVQDADVVTVPIDTTLTRSGEAADAKAVGDALALKADKSELAQAIEVNGQGADSQGKIIVYGTDIEMSDTDSTTLKAKIEAVDGKSGADIPLTSSTGSQTVKQAIDAANSRTAADILMASSDPTTVAAQIVAMGNTETELGKRVDNILSSGGDALPVHFGSEQTIGDALDGCVKSVNGEGPDESGNVQVQHALTADNLTSSSSQTSIGEWVRRTSGGSASISDGNAWLSGIRGNRVHVGYVPEVLNMTVNAAPREEGETPITATIDRDTFVAYVSQSGTINLTFTTSWSADPALYGVTVTGTPVSGDQITIVYTKEDRGTIIQSDPQSMVSTGWNLYNHDTGYTMALKYANPATFKIEGTYTAVKFSSTISGEKTTITPSDGLFTIEANGYIWVEGGNTTDTALYMTWGDWVLEGPSTFEVYTEDVIDLSDVMAECFPYGLLRVGDVRDEIDFNTGTAISNVQRLSYSAENVAAAEASGRTWEADGSYIYLERAAAVVTDIDVDGEYAVSDHGMEYFTDTDLAVYAIVIYGNNLKNKLERDVLTKSQDLVDNLVTNDATKALSAKQGKALSDQIGNKPTYASQMAMSSSDSTKVSTAISKLKVKSVTTSGTTNANGSLEIPTSKLDPTKHVPLFAGNNSGYNCSFYVSSGKYFIKYWSSSGTTFQILANASAAPTIYYLEI